MRISASILTLSPSNHILFMLRPKSGTFPTSYVFPGGVIEPQDNGSLVHCGIREVYEETGLLVQSDGKKDIVHNQINWPEAQSLLAPFREESYTEGLRAFSTWVTPPNLKKRFRTQFFLHKTHIQHDFSNVQLNPDEVTSLLWLTPKQALEKFNNKEIRLMPPQYYLIEALEELGIEEALTKLGDRVFEPAVMGKKDGKVIMDWGKGESGLIRFDKDGSVSEIEHIRGQSEKSNI